MDDLANLELLSLTTKIAAEIQNHTGVSDKTLAEFLIDQHVECGSLSTFKEAIGNDLPNSLIESIDRLVRTLHPAYNGSKKNKKLDDSKSSSKSKSKEVFKGLSIPDQPDVMDDTFALLESMAPTSKSKPAGGESKSRREKSAAQTDDTFALLEQLAPKSRTKEKDSQRSDRDSDRKSRSSRKTQDSKRDRSRSRSRSRSPDHRRKRRGREDRSPTRDKQSRRRDGSVDSADEFGRTRRVRNRSPTPDREPQIGKIYNGRVTGVKDFGAFVALDGVRGRAEGLVHVSALMMGRVEHPSDVVTRGDMVKVKVVKCDNGRVSLSMKDVNQSTGEDISQPRFATGANLVGTSYADPINKRSDQVPVVENFGSSKKNGARTQRMTSPERWEIKQLIAAGALSAQDFPDIDEDPATGANGEMAVEDEDIDIEVREEEPPFLAGQTKLSLELSPIRVVKAPDGSLNRAAQASDEKFRERRELRDQQAREEAAKKASEVDLSEQWQDPISIERKFAGDFREAKPQTEMPEWKRISSGKETRGQRSNLSIAEQRRTLPVHKFRKQFLEAVRENQMLIVVGDTGSGKTTQLTQYLAEDGFAKDLMIGCTQPRRVAAVSVAERVAREVGVPVGAEVGYTIRFEDRTSPATRIKYMTDGIMQREILLDPILTKYSVIMLDEAHERSIPTDILFGLLKKAVKRRPDLKIIITSATLDAEKFSNYFNRCPIFSIPGRTFPVEVMYSREPEMDYLEASLTTVMQIHLTEPAGDILLFLTGRDEIDTSCEILYERMKALGPTVPELVILPIYGALPTDVASRIFEPAPPFGRKVVIATNIAETSITIDGIFYVVDPGFVKQNAYDPKLGMDRLQVTPISQAQAKQRAGRAGRTGPGKCFRLYTEAAYESEMLPTTVPEIQRQNLANTILMLKAMGINDLLHFDFMDPPPTNTLLTALEDLYALSALDEEGLLTRLGRQMADFPMDPELSKTLIASADLACSDELLTIVSMISGTSTIFHRPKEKQSQADQKKAKFHDPHGDHLTLLNVYNRWRDSDYSVPWCFDHFVQPQALRRVRDVRDQLKTILDRHKLRIVSCGSDRDRVRRALCAGFFRNTARKDPNEGYKTLVEGTAVYMHPSSALFGKPAEHVIYHHLFETSKEYMQHVSTIDPRWLVEAAPTFFKVAPSNKLSKRQREERIQPLANQYGRDDDWRLSTQRRQGRGGGGTWG